MMPIKTSAPSTTHSQMRSVPELLPAAGDCAAAEVAGSGAVGAAAAVARGLRLGRLTLGTLALGARLLMALLTVPPHPVTSKPATRAAARGTTHLIQRRGPRPPGDRSAKNAPASTAQASPGRSRRASPVTGDLGDGTGRGAARARSGQALQRITVGLAGEGHRDHFLGPAGFHPGEPGQREPVGPGQRGL